MLVGTNCGMGAAMTNSVVGWIVTVAVLASVSPLGSESARPRLKCATVIGPPVYVLNGMIVPVEFSRPRDPKTILSIQVLCSGESDRVFGVEPGRSLAVIWTNAAPSARVKRSVESIVNRQGDYARRYGVFSRSLSDLGWTDRSGSITVRLCVSEDGRRWNALGWQSAPSSGPGVLRMGTIATGTDAASDIGYRCQLSQSTPRESL